MLATIFFTAIAGTALLPASVMPDCSIVSYAMDLRSCFKIRKMGDEVMIHNKATIVETSLQLEGFLKDPQRVCSEKRKFTELFDCLGGTTKKCITKEAEKSYLPDATLAKQGLEYFCDHINNINQACYNQSYGEVFQCVKTLSDEHLKSDDSPATIACTTVDITHDCINEHMSCDEKTRDLLLKFQDEYRKPTGCEAPTRTNRKKYITSTGSSTAILFSKLFCVCLSFFIILLQTE